MKTDISQQDYSRRAAYELRGAIDVTHGRLDALIAEREQLVRVGGVDEKRLAQIAAEERALDLEAAALLQDAEHRFGINRFLRMTA